MSDDDRPFVIERPGPKGRIRLNADARHWAHEHGMTLAEFARHLLLRDEQGGMDEMPDMPELPELPDPAG
jgi:hypothetical protein